MANDAQKRIVYFRDGYHAIVDPADQVLHVSIHSRYVTWGQEEGGAAVPTAIPIEVGTTPTCVSASLLGYKSKAFDDGLYAALELALQEGGANVPSRREFLARICSQLSVPDDPEFGGATIYAAAELGGLAPEVPAVLRHSVDEVKQRFLAAALRSRPIGFYTWNADLSRIFQQDRMLQEQLTSLDAGRVAHILHRDAELRKQYQYLLRIPEILTNPWPADRSDVESILDRLVSGQVLPTNASVALFPPSRSHETDLIKALYGARSVPVGFNLADELVRRIRDGDLNLEPTPTSGFYAYQTWALEPLVAPDRMPEAPRLNLDETYRRQLDELFRGLLTLRRETHIKQLEIPLVGAAAGPRFKVRPELRVEPVPQFYLRSALGYRFLRRELTRHLGADFLATLHRLTPVGPVRTTIDAELLAMERLFVGAYVATCVDLGSPLRTPGAVGSGSFADDLAHFLAWRSQIAEDPDLGHDLRAMVPVYYDVEKRTTQVWMILGWAERKATVQYQTPPGVLLRSPGGEPVPASEADLGFEPAYFTLTYPVMAEAPVTRILNREEFRAHCDKHRSVEAILKHLE